LFVSLFCLFTSSVCPPRKNLGGTLNVHNIYMNRELCCCRALRHTAWVAFHFSSAEARQRTAAESQMPGAASPKGIQCPPPPPGCFHPFFATSPHSQILSDQSVDMYFNSDTPAKLDTLTPITTILHLNLTIKKYCFLPAMIIQLGLY